jgi:hypothetical protein
LSNSCAAPSRTAWPGIVLPSKSLPSRCT